ncbi:MAG: 2-amino-4-hydroxy-6-hydroxymethyldihydropteridine diphosphokinase [Spirochaetales bacterium]|uniref:2-amino-4-hydroxy-6-hydroxymethyldihydropteridine pyrophosphokinase n=1 Tax=Candidatus Thalassospirochaeta sargassi TaxID=3119039 RepID=A0AAJ1IAV2_9SPIO|nr:2-amino-4-hydroxy-6-hydroxymethyldihydropteridine diphosphokinase [Spirochaetales bacterium]
METASPDKNYGPVEVFLGLGANIGDSVSNILTAFERIKTGVLSNAELSSLYITEPQDVEKQPDFINAACRGVFSGTAFELHSGISKIEAGLGRNRSNEQRRGPRLIDIDILYFGGMIINSGNEADGEGNWLRIPHERLKNRRFALVPLIELSPRLTDPQSGVLYSTINEELSGQGIYTFDTVRYIKSHGAES